MGKHVPTSAKVFLVVNCLATLGFAFLLLIQPSATDLDVRGSYTQLDREGVINQDALARFHPNYGFTAANHRNSVPRYIAGPALGAQRANAAIGLAVAATNLAVAVWVLLAARRA